MRGTSSSANAVTPASRSARTVASSVEGDASPDRDRAAAESRGVLGFEGPHVSEHVDVVEVERVDHGRAGLRVRRVGVTGCLAGTTLDEHRQPETGQLAHGLGGGGDSPLTRTTLCGDTDPHGLSSHMGVQRCRRRGDPPVRRRCCTCRSAYVPMGVEVTPISTMRCWSSATQCASIRASPRGTTTPPASLGGKRAAVVARSCGPRAALGVS